MPHSNEVHADAHLSSFIAGYTPGDMIADIVAPIVETPKISDTYKKLLRKDIERVVDDLLAEDGEASEISYAQAAGSYNCLHRALKGLVSGAVQTNADEPEDPEEFTAQQVMWALSRMREIRVANAYATAGNYAASNTSAAANPWTDVVNGTPIEDIEVMKAAIPPGMEDQTELALVLSKPVWTALRKHPKMLGNGFVKPRVSNDEARDILEVERIIVADNFKDTTNRNAPSTSTRIWSPTEAYMVRLPKREPRGVTGLFMATYRFVVEGELPIAVRKWFEPGRGRGGSNVVQVEFSDDEVAVQNDMAYRLTGAAA